VFFHGGGWIVGTLGGHDAMCSQVSAATDAVMVSVDYRLAPLHPFPAAVEDCYAALHWPLTTPTSSAPMDSVSASWGTVLEATSLWWCSAGPRPFRPANPPPNPDVPKH
jgi:hypothetical protein